MSSDHGSSPIAIAVRNVGKCYHIYDRPVDRLRQSFWRGRKAFYREFWALRGVSLEVGRGEAIGIIGRNGSGKSTLLQIVAGTLSPSEGEIEVHGRVAALLELGSGFSCEFTGRENVFMSGSILGLSREEIQQRFDAIASFADIGVFLDQPVRTYSSGMVVRLAFAVQVQVEPDILIVDEALAVGDLLFQKRCFQRLRELREKGCTILFVSHDLESVRTLTDRAMFLRDGSAAVMGEPGEVLLAYRRFLHEEEARELRTAIPVAPAPPDSTPSSLSEPLPQDQAAQAQRKVFGDGDAEILDVEVLDGAYQPCTLFYPGDMLVIRMAVRFRVATVHANVSLRLRNREGIKVYSWGTLNQDISIWSGRAQGPVFWDRTFQAGQTVVVEFSCPVALGQSFYEVQAAVTEEKDHYYNQQRTLIWKDEAAFFQIKQNVREYFFGGAFDMHMKAAVVM